MIYNKVCFGKKGFNFFISYKEDEKVTLLCIMFSKMRGYLKSFGEMKYMSLLIKMINC